MIASVLPLPIHQYVDVEDVEEDDKEEAQVAIGQQQQSKKEKFVIPSYPFRVNFIPTKYEHFGDGGAFPEIHVAQYPLDMGKPGSKSTAVVTVDVDESGEIRYDAILRQGANKDKLIKTSLNDMKESKGDRDALALPDEEEEQNATERTRLALEALLEGKIKKAKPTTIKTSGQSEEPTYIRYTPNPNAPGYNPNVKNRVVKMVEAQVDPMEPPKHRIKKVVRGPPSPPAPVLHSPPRKLTVKDQQAWKIPPCVSNWKNAHGYTIPLDKRLAADGRGLQEITINNKFASLSETLYIAERKAAEDLRVRNQLRKKMAMKEKEDKEKDLIEMAKKAREERAAVLNSSTKEKSEDKSKARSRSESSESTASSVSGKSSRSGRSPSESRSRSRNKNKPSRSSDRNRSSSRSRTPEKSSRRGKDDRRDREQDEDDNERVARIQRERLRIEQRKEREREIRLENMKGTMRKNKIDRDLNRDVSEKIALGMHRGTGQVSGEAMYDSRLFNQSSGMDSGFGAEDEYTTYSKPLFDRKEGGSIYRPKRDDSEFYGDVDSQIAKLSDTSKFKPDKGFMGAEGGEHVGGRDAPVQFEKAKADPFGIEDIVSSRKKSRKEY